MAFQSKSQMRRFDVMLKAGQITQEQYDKHNGETDHAALPEKVEQKAPKPKTLLRKKHYSV